MFDHEAQRSADKIIRLSNELPEYVGSLRDKNTRLEDARPFFIV